MVSQAESVMLLQVQNEFTSVKGLKSYFSCKLEKFALEPLLQRNLLFKKCFSCSAEAGDTLKRSFQICKKLFDCMSVTLTKG